VEIDGIHSVEIDGIHSVEIDGIHSVEIDEKSTVWMKNIPQCGFWTLNPQCGFRDKNIPHCGIICLLDRHLLYYQLFPESFRSSMS